MLTEAVILTAQRLGCAIRTGCEQLVIRNHRPRIDSILPLRARDADNVDRAARHTDEARNRVDGDAEEAKEDGHDVVAGRKEALAALHGAGAAGLGGRRGGGCLGRRGAGGGDRKEGEHEDEDLVHEVHLDQTAFFGRTFRY